MGGSGKKNSPTSLKRECEIVSGCKERPQPSFEALRLVLRSERAGVDVLTEWGGSLLWVCAVQSGEQRGRGFALYSVLRWRVLRAGQCIVKGAERPPSWFEARPQLVVSTAALRHQLVGGGPGSYSFYGVFGVEGTYVLAGFTCNLLRLWILE